MPIVCKGSSSGGAGRVRTEQLAEEAAAVDAVSMGDKVGDSTTLPTSSSSEGCITSQLDCEDVADGLDVARLCRPHSRVLSSISGKGGKLEVGELSPTLRGELVSGGQLSGGDGGGVSVLKTLGGESVVEKDDGVCSKAAQHLNAAEKVSSGGQGVQFAAAAGGQLVDSRCDKSKLNGKAELLKHGVELAVNDPNLFGWRDSMGAVQGRALYRRAPFTAGDSPCDISSFSSRASAAAGGQRIQDTGAVQIGGWDGTQCEASHILDDSAAYIASNADAAASDREEAADRIPDMELPGNYYLVSL